MIDSTLSSVEFETQLNYGSLSNNNNSVDETPSLLAKGAFREKENRPIVLSTLIAGLVGTIVIFLALYANLSKVNSNDNAEFGTLFQSDALSDEQLQPSTKSMYCLSQQVDHFDPDDNRTWSHPYFISDDYFKGPGSPIFVIIGGEGAVHRILYPFVSKKLAYEFGGYVLQTEHRFYGASQPVGDNPSTQELRKLLTPEQAIADFIHLIESLRLELGCSLSKRSPNYCPVVTVGGSYPAFLAAIMRQSFSDVIDIAYAASAPMILNAHHEDADTNAYYDHVSNVADRAWPGCADGTRQTLKKLHRDISDDFTIDRVSRNLGICQSSIPLYMKASAAVFARELTQLVVDVSADANMEFYPPTEDTLLIKTCKAFTEETSTAQKRYRNFLSLLKDTDDYKKDTSLTDDCFDLQTQMPDGPNASISSADWSGAGSSQTGTRWEFQVCKDLVIKCGYAGPSSMFFPQREWTLEWLTDHCQNRFGPDLKPEPGRLNKLWKFDTLEGASRIIFTNGVNDGWITGSFTESSSDSVMVLNFANGSHHSDLMHEWPANDTDDIVEGHNKIINTLWQWLMEIAREKDD